MALMSHNYISVISYIQLYTYTLIYAYHIDMSDVSINIYGIPSLSDLTLVLFLVLCSLSVDIGI